MSRSSAAFGAAAVLGIAAGALLVTAPAASADGLPTPSLSKTAVTTGETFTISGSGCLPDDESDRVSVSVDAPPAVTQLAPDPDGSWSVTGTEVTTFAGTYPLHATCWHAGGVPEDYPAVSITVVAPPKWWQTCGPLPGNSGVTGCPGPPNLSVPSTARRTTPAPTTVPPPAGRRTTTAAAPSTVPTPPSPTAAATVAAPATPAATPASGCPDCWRLTGAQAPRPGERLRLAFTGFRPGERVTLVLHSTPMDLGTYAADASGVVTAQVTVPRSAEAGAHTLVLTGPVTGARVLDVRVAPATGPSGRAPSPSGGEPVVIAVLVAAGAALAAGGGLALHHRRAVSAAARRGGTPAAG